MLNEKCCFDEPILVGIDFSKLFCTTKLSAIVLAMHEDSKKFNTLQIQGTLKPKSVRTEYDHRNGAV